MFFEIEFLIEDRYWGKGVIEINGNEFEGHINDEDYLAGEYIPSMQILSIDLYKYDSLKSLTTSVYSCFTVQEEFELPGDFYLNPMKEVGSLAYFKVKQKYHNPQEARKKIKLAKDLNNVLEF